MNERQWFFTSVAVKGERTKIKKEWFDITIIRGPNEIELNRIWIKMKKKMKLNEMSGMEWVKGNGITCLEIKLHEMKW